MLFSGGVREEMKIELGVKRVEHVGVYLGLPMNVGRSREVIFKSLVEKKIKGLEK